MLLKKKKKIHLAKPACFSNKYSNSLNNCIPGAIPQEVIILNDYIIQRQIIFQFKIKENYNQLLYLLVILNSKLNV